MVDEAIVLDMVQGEDFACQLYWTDQNNNAIRITDPIQMDVKDALGQIVMRFVSTADSATHPYLMYVTNNGFIQLTVPKEFTSNLAPGRYEFDLFATCADSSIIFSTPVRQLVKGFVDVSRSITKTVDPAWAGLAE